VVRYTHGELFLPTAVGPYVQRCSLWIHEPGTPPDTSELLVPPGELSLDRLAALGRIGATARWSCVSSSSGRAGRRCGRGAARAGGRRGVGADGRLVAAAVAVAAGPHAGRHSSRCGGSCARLQRCAYYGRVVRDGDYIVVQSALHVRRC